MNLPSEQLEQMVVAKFELMLERYQQMDQLASEILADESSVTRFDDAMKKLQSAREEIEKLHLDSQEINERYRATRDKASSTVKQLSETMQNLIQGLLIKISELERRAKDSCKHLVPEINANVRAVQMKNAYGKYT